MRRPVVYSPLGLLVLLVLATAVVVAVGLLFLNLVTTSFSRIGFGWQDALLLLLASLVGSQVNIPVARLRSRQPIAAERYVRMFGIVYRIPVAQREQQVTVLAVNVGGAVVPVLVSVYLLVRVPATWPYALAATAVVALLVHQVARPVRGIGIVTPALVPPLLAALTASTVVAIFGAPAETRFVAAYVSGTLGTLIGADLLNLGRVPDLGAPVASIGGAGTFDGIFLTGLVAVLLV